MFRVVFWNYATRKNSLQRRDDYIIEGKSVQFGLSYLEAHVSFVWKITLFHFLSWRLAEQDKTQIMFHWRKIIKILKDPRRTTFFVDNVALLVCAKVFLF